MELEDCSLPYKLGRALTRRPLSCPHPSAQSSRALKREVRMNVPRVLLSASLALVVFTLGCVEAPNTFEPGDSTPLLGKVKDCPAHPSCKPDEPPPPEPGGDELALLGGYFAIAGAAEVTGDNKKWLKVSATGLGVSRSHRGHRNSLHDRDRRSGNIEHVQVEGSREQSAVGVGVNDVTSVYINGIDPFGNDLADGAGLKLEHVDRQRGKVGQEHTGSTGQQTREAPPTFEELLGLTPRLGDAKEAAAAGQEYDCSVISPVQLVRIRDDARGEDRQRRASVERNPQNRVLAVVPESDPLSVGRESRIACLLRTGQKAEASFAGPPRVERCLTLDLTSHRESGSVRSHNDIAEGVGYDFV